MEFIITTEEKLKGIISEAVTAALRNIAPPPAPATIEPEAPITDTEARQLVNRSRQALYNWRRKGLITAHNFNGRLFYFRSELLDALRQEATR